jgi:hypothetical protein
MKRLPFREEYPLSELRDRIHKAVAARAREVVIPPGIYRGGPAKAGETVLAIQGAENLRIVARGVTMVCTSRTRALEFYRCRNIEVVGLTIDYDPLTFTQGTVIAVASDKSWIDVKVDAGYPRMPYSRIDVVDPRTRYRKHGMPFLWGTKAAMVQPDVVRVTLKGIGDAAPVGTLASLNEGNEPGGICHGIDLEYCGGGMVLRDITLHCAPGMGIVEHAGDGGTRIIGLRIVPGPPPPGATQPRLLTTSWDGILHTEVRRGPIVGNCTIEDCGDDTWSVQSSPLLVVKSGAEGIVLAGSIDLRPGDHLRQSLDSNAWVVRTVRRMPIKQAALDPAVVERLDKAPQWTLWSVGHETVQLVTLEPSSAPPAVGISVYSPENQGSSFVFRNNRVHSSGRILIKAGDGLVENNTLRDIHNVVVMPEVSVGGAFSIARVTIRNNRILGAENFNTMPWSLQAGGLCVGSLVDSPAGSFADITIEGNTFEDISAANIWISGVRGLTITRNRFIRPGERPLSDSGAKYGVDHSAVVRLRNCDQVRLARNVITFPGTYVEQAISLDRTVTDATGAEAGIVVQKER